VESDEWRVMSEGSPQHGKDHKEWHLVEARGSLLARVIDTRMMQ
jgi:hypothetical protein